MGSVVDLGQIHTKQPFCSIYKDYHRQENTTEVIYCVETSGKLASVNTIQLLPQII